MGGKEGGGDGVGNFCPTQAHAACDTLLMPCSELFPVTFCTGLDAMLRIFSCNLSKMAHLEDVVTLQALHSSFNVLVSFMFYGELSDLYSLETFWFKLNFNLLVRLLCVLLSKNNNIQQPQTSTLRH